MAVAKKKNRRRRKKFTLPVAVAAGLFGGMEAPIRFAADGKVSGALDNLSKNYTGYTPSTRTFNANDLKRGLLPLAIGILVHKGATIFGVNRAIASTGLPWLRI